MTWLGWQIDYLLLLQNFRDFSHHIFDNFFLHITMCSETMFIAILTCVVYWTINKQAGRYMIICYNLGVLATSILKTTFCIYRPWLLSSKIHPLAQAIPKATGYSFPSGHTMCATTSFGALARWFNKNNIVKYSAILLITLIMFSRNYLGVHTPQDVVVSLFVGSIIVLVVYKFYDKLTEKVPNFSIFIFLITLFCILLYFYTQFKSYPIDYLCGKIIYNPIPMKQHILSYFGISLGSFYGLYLEKRLVNFNIENMEWCERIVRLLVGIGCVVMLDSLIKNILILYINKTLTMFIYYFVICFFITFIYPLIMKLYQFNKSK